MVKARLFLGASHLTLGVCVIGVIALSGCQTLSSNDENIKTASPASYSSSSLSHEIYQDFKSDDEFVMSMIIAAKKAEDEDRMQDAAVFLAKAYDKQPENPEIAWRYGRLLRLNNRGDKAVILLTPYSVRSNPSEDILREYSASLLSDGKVQTADYIITQLLETAPKDSSVWNIGGIVADAKGDTQEAVSRFEKGLELVPEGSERERSILLNNMALAKAKAGLEDDARSDISKAMTGAQYYPQIRKNYKALGMIYDVNTGEAHAINTPADSKVDAVVVPAENTTNQGIEHINYPLPAKKPQLVGKVEKANSAAKPDMDMLQDTPDTIKPDTIK